MSRYPDGIDGKTFYQKQCPDFAPPWLPQWRYRHQSSDKTIVYCVINKLEDLIWLVNLGCIEIHVWLSTIHNPHHPDFVVWDLDPGPGILFDDVVETALLLNKALAGLGLKGFPKISGGKGIHVFLPIRSQYTFEDTRKFSLYISKMLEGANPRKLTTNRDISGRKNKIYLDYLQNGLGKTMASVFSVRPLPNAPISLPVAWDELEQGKIEYRQFTIDIAQHLLEEKAKLFESILDEKFKIDTFLAKIN